MRGGTHGTLIDNGSDVKFRENEKVKCRRGMFLVGCQRIKKHLLYVHDCTSVHKIFIW